MFNSMPEFVSASAVEREAEIRRMGLVREAEKSDPRQKPARRRACCRESPGAGRREALQNPAVAKS